MNKFFAVLMIVIGVFVILRSHQLAERQVRTATWLFGPFRNYLYLSWILGGIGFILIGGGYLVGIFK
jgi:hypothetical protein